MAIQTKTITANGSKGHHRFTLRVNEDTTSDNSSFMSYTFTISPIQSGWDWANWGSQISYSVSVGSNSYTGTIPAYNGSTTVTLSSGSNIEIPHETDGTKSISISFSVTDTTGQSYTCGNASASDTFRLTDLHKAPDITNCVISSELNTQLTNLSLATGTIAQYLSKKTFTVTATPYDNATISTYDIYHNNVLIGTSSSNVITVDFKDVSELQTTLSSGTYYVGLTIAVTDNKSGYSTRAFNFPVIKYTRPTMEMASTYIKRKTTGGTTLTQSICDLVFVGTCYKGNDVIGNNNTPQVQYKIWNITEPSYTNLTTPNQASISTSTQLSSIDYLKSWQYKIKIKDTFSDYDVSPFVKTDKVPTGVSVWSEYKDHVNFLSATVDNKSVLVPYELYTDANGSNANITLSETASNFDYLEIHYFENHSSQGFSSVRIYEPDGKIITLDQVAHDESNARMYISSSYYTISGTSITLNSCYSWAISNSPYAVGNTNQMYITKVIGYK